MRKLLVSIWIVGWLSIPFWAGMALAAAPAGNPWPIVTPTAASHRVLVIGDSLAKSAATQLPGVLASHGFTNTTVVNRGVDGTNLIDNYGYFTPVGWARYLIDTNPTADTIVVNYVGTCRCEGWVPAYGSAAWFRVWRDRAHQIIDYAEAQGRTVLWTMGPPIGADFNPPWFLYLWRTVAQSLTYEALVDYGPRGSGVVNWWAGLSRAEGGYSTSLAYDGADHTVRTGDTVHFTDDGAWRASVWTAGALGVVWG